MKRLGLPLLLVSVVAVVLIGSSCSNRTTGGYVSIRINEVVADDGNFGWIELYNANDFPVDLTGYYLSDSSGNRRKWRFPQGTVIGTREDRGINSRYLVILTGGDPADSPTGQLVADFGLDEDLGEKVVLTHPDGSFTLDDTAFPPLGTGVSWMRDPSEPPRWMPSLRPTRGGANTFVDVLLRIVDISPVLPYSSVTITVTARGELAASAPGGGSPVRLYWHYRYEPVSDAWREVDMTRVGSSPDGHRFSFTISGESHGVKPLVEAVAGDTSTRTRVNIDLQLFVAALSRRGEWISSPYQDGFDPEEFVVSDPPLLDGETMVEMRVGFNSRAMITEIMPSNSFVRADPGHRRRSADWLEIINHGSTEISRMKLAVARADDPFSFYVLETGTETRRIAPGVRWKIFADEEKFGNTNAPDHLLFTLSPSGGTIRLLTFVAGGSFLLRDAIELDRVTFTSLEGDTAFGRENSRLGEAAQVLRTPTPGFSNAPPGDPVWFAGDNPVWTEWGSRANPTSTQTVTIRARVSWDSAWELSIAGAGSAVEKEYAFFPEPEVVLWWGTGSALEHSAAMARRRGSEVFEAQIPAQTATVRYLIEAIHADGTSQWHGAGGVVSSEPDGLQPHAYTPDFDSVSAGVRITEVGMTGEYLPVPGTDGGGRRQTFVEIFNGGDAVFPAGGSQGSFFISLHTWQGEVDTPRQFPEEWEISGVEIAPGAYHAVYLDGDRTDGPSLLARYNGCQASINESVDRGNGTIDRLSVPRLEDWEIAGAYGLLADGSTPRAMAPSPGQPNLDPVLLFINEISVWDAAEPWIELYNAGGTAAELDGLRLGDENEDREIVAGGRLIEPGGFAVVWLDDDPGHEVRLKLTSETDDFAFDPTESSVYLFASSFWIWGRPHSQLDGMSYQEGAPWPAAGFGPWPTPPAGWSLGRVPDGGPRFEHLPPSPGASNGGEPGALFIRGDCDGNGEIDLTTPPQDNSDLEILAEYITQAPWGKERHPCEDRLDVNDDGRVDTADITYYLRHVLYTDEPGLPAPFPDPGTDPTEDELGCVAAEDPGR